MSQNCVLRFPFRAMACACEISMGLQSGQEPDWAAAMARMAIAEVHRIEAKYSRYRSDSVVSQINAAAGIHPLELDAETLALLDFADRMHAQSEGLFDITSGVYRQVWDFQRPRCPDAPALAQVRALVGWSKTQRAGNHFFLPSAGMQIDFGGLGKEYAADRAAWLLRQQGVKHALVNLGGDIVSIGGKPGGTPWSAGIQHPREPEQVMATLNLSGQALATSGDYERFFELDGRRYCHIIQPLTGWPVQHFRSVSVVAPSCLLAGALCTTIMLKEADATQEWLQQLGLPVLWMDSCGQIHMQTVS